MFTLFIARKIILHIFSLPTQLQMGILNAREYLYNKYKNKSNLTEQSES